MSHGSHKDVAARNAACRKVWAGVGRPIAVLVDLQGPKLRVGRMAAGTDLEPGRPFRLDLDREEGDATGAPLPHREIFEALEPGTTVLLNDGKIRLHVEKVGKDYADTTVMVGGGLTTNTGVNVPAVCLPFAALSEKDRRTLNFAMTLGGERGRASCGERGCK